MILKCSPLLGVILSLFSTNPAFAQTLPIEVDEIPFCEGTVVDCDRFIDVIEIAVDQYDIFINSAAKREATDGGTRIFFDSLFNYAANTQAIAVFSGGFIRDLNPLAPLGGLKVDGRRISRIVGIWKDSTIVCSDSGSLILSRDLTTFDSGTSCLQSGPTVLDGKRTEEDLKSDLLDRWPSGFWGKLTRRVIVLRFENGNNAFVIAREHSYSEVYSFLKGNNFGGKKVELAVGLNGGPWSGYIIRTLTEPKIVGDIDFVFPSVFLVRSKK